MRYFVSVNPDGTPVTLFRFDVTKDAVIDQVFRGGAWASSENTIAKALTDGSTDYEEIAEPHARKMYPAAF